MVRGKSKKEKHEWSAEINNNNNKKFNKQTIKQTNQQTSLVRLKQRYHVFRFEYFKRHRQES